MRFNRFVAEAKKYDELRDQDFGHHEALRLAKEYAEDLYWEFVDRGREMAKDRHTEGDR